MLLNKIWQFQQEETMQSTLIFWQCTFDMSVLSLGWCVIEGKERCH